MNATLRDIVNQACIHDIAATGYADPAMILYTIRQLLEKNPTELPDGIVIENEKDEATPGGLLRISPAALPYINDLRRGILFERWCDEVVKCPVQQAQTEFCLLWKDAAAWSNFLQQINSLNVQDAASRISATILHVVPLLSFSTDYIEVTWAWLQELRQSPLPEIQRLVSIKNTEMQVAMCRACLDREVVSAEAMAEVLSACGLTHVWKQLGAVSALPSPSLPNSG